MTKYLLFSVESNLHKQWNVFGTYCFVPTENDIIAMLDALRKGNQKWSQYILSCKNATRPLDVRPRFFANIDSNSLIGNEGAF